LAIKDSSHPPARWFHEKAEIGSPVAVRVGGSFFYEPTAGVENVVFLAAGVGINPLLSMLRSIRHSKKRPSRVQLLYASKADDLLFLDQVQACLPTKDVQLFITQPPSLRLAISPAFERIHNRRFTAADVRAAIPSPQETAVYLCGPAQMTDEYEAILCGEGGLGLDRNRVFFERWW
jgi:ferredoxin-NADP reductase